MVALQAMIRSFRYQRKIGKLSMTIWKFSQVTVRGSHSGGYFSTWPSGLNAVEYIHTTGAAQSTMNPPRASRSPAHDSSLRVIGVLVRFAMGRLDMACSAI